MLTKDGEGLYRINGAEMPCRPQELKICRWAIPGALGDAESEDIAARIISFSFGSGIWVGVTRRRLVQMLTDDLSLALAWEAYKNALSKRRWYWPFAGAAIKPTAEMPASVVFLPNGTYNLLRAVHLLARRGMLELVTANNEVIICPKPALVQAIMASQKP